MSTAQTRLELILELNNRINSGLSQAKTQIRSDVGDMQNRLNSFANSSRNSLRSVANELPAISGGLSSLVNPAMIATAGIGAITTGLIKATDKAADFNHEFRDLANLNLDKSKKEIDGLRSMVLNTSYRKGFQKENTINAYNELQSTTGIYGVAARPIVEKQGEFAVLMKTSMDDYVAGTAKAMANWRFGIDKLDAYNKSNYAAMQVGVVSFQELSKVQSTFAGSAASINQSFDTANKLFSIFTVKTKSVDEAATLTKSLFSDLTKAQTVKSFKSIGIDLFDTNKQLKQADVIMLELNDKFKTMKNDKAIVALKNQFKGSEGLIAMIQTATDRTDNLRSMLNEFQNSKYNADMALSQAHNDIVQRQIELTNRVDVLITNLGNKMLPWKAKLLEVAEGVVDRVNWNTKTPDEKKLAIKEAQQIGVYENFGHLKDINNLSEDQYKKRQNFIHGRYLEHKSAYDKKTLDISKQLNDKGITHSRERFIERVDHDANYDRHQDLYRSKAFLSLGLDMQEAWTNKNKQPESIKPTGAGGGSGSAGGDLSGITDSLNRVVGSAQAPRNITVNIDAFNKGGINTQNTSLQKMDESAIENWFTDMCMRVVNNVELSYN